MSVFSPGRFEKVLRDQRCEQHFEQPLIQVTVQIGGVKRDESSAEAVADMVISRGDLCYTVGELLEVWEFELFTHSDSL